MEYFIKITKALHSQKKITIKKKKLEIGDGAGGGNKPLDFRMWILFYNYLLKSCIK